MPRYLRFDERAKRIIETDEFPRDAASCSCCDSPDMPVFTIIGLGVGLGLLACSALRRLTRRLM